MTPGPWRWKTHQFNYGEPEYDYLYSIVNGEQVLRPTGTDNPIAVDPEDARRIAMAGDPVIGHILDERAADLASGPRAEEGVQDWFATRLSTHQPSFGPRGMRGHGASYAIHQSAWKTNSANFAITEFSEVASGDPMVRSFPVEYQAVQSPTRSREAVHRAHEIVTVL